jgi:hypothetical protein
LRELVVVLPVRIELTTSPYQEAALLIYSSGRRYTSAVLKYGRSCYILAMTKDQVKEILDRVLTWPAERQADVAHVVEIMEQQDRSDLRLSEEQAAEVRRRLAEPNSKTIPAEDVFKRYRTSGT